MQRLQSWRRILVHASISALAVVVSGSIFATAGEPVTPWAEVYDGPVQGEDVGFRVATSPDGSMVYSAGWSKGEHGFDYVVLAYTADGTPAWTFRYDGTGHARDGASALAVAPDGSTVYVTGLSVGVGTRWDIVTIAIDAATGGANWVRRFDGASHGQDVGNDVITSADGGRIFVTGCITTARDDCVALTVAYVAATGERVWVSRSNGSGEGVDTMYDATLSANGAKVVVTGVADDMAGPAMAVVAYRATDGAESWSRHYRGGPRGDRAWGNAVVASEQGLVHVTGVVRTGSQTEEDFATAAFDSGTGDLVWVKRFDAYSFDDSAWDIAGDDSTDSIFVTGTARWQIDDNVWGTLAYDAVTGQRRWVRLTDGGAWEDESFAVALLPDGAGVVVAGLHDSLVADCGIVVYDPTTGAMRWWGEYDPDPDYGNYCSDVTTGTPDGRIYLTGVIWNSSLDALTLAFDVPSEPTASATRLVPHGAHPDRVGSLLGASFGRSTRASPLLRLIG